MKEQAKTKAGLVFKTFPAVYGHKWASILEESSRELVFKIWSRCLEGLTDEEFKTAMESCVKLYAFPPSIAEFLYAAYDFYSDIDAYNIVTNPRWRYNRMTLVANYNPELIKNKMLMITRYNLRDILFKHSPVQEYNPHVTPEKISEYDVMSQKEELRLWSKEYKQIINDFLKSSNPV